MRVAAVALVILATVLAAVAVRAGSPAAITLSRPDVPTAPPTASSTGTPATTAVAGGGIVPTLPGLGQARVRTDKNCYLPGQYITITLKNVGTGPLVWGSLPDYEIENETIGAVRMIKSFQRGSYVLGPAETRAWTWDQRWDAWNSDGSPIHKGELVPRARYTVNIEVFIGFPQGEVVTVATSHFTIGECFAQITAGDDIVVDEGQTFQFNPVIQITGDATVNSVTWDVDPTVDSDGDGNFTNDADLFGTHPSYAFGDDGVYNVTMTLKGTGTISGFDRRYQDVVFALDSSESMNWSDPYGLRKAASKAYADLLVPDDMGAVVDFNEFGHLTGGTHLGTNYSVVKANVDSVGASGPLFLSAGLMVSLWEIRDYGNASHKGVVIFMSSAQSDNPRDSYYIPQAIDLAKSLNVTIYTVGLGITDPDLVDLMRTIAQSTGGEYFPAPTAGNMRAIYDDVGAGTNWTKHLPFTVTDTLSVTVKNVAPSVPLGGTFPMHAVLRMSGDKSHEVAVVLTRDGVEFARTSVTRIPGDPDDQKGAIALDVPIVGSYALRLEYTPSADPRGGNGANPAWLALLLPGGSRLVFHHVFNAGDPASWVWEFPEVQRYFLGRTIALTAHVTDPGSDDETVIWDWGDGAVETRVFYNDGVGPDPYPSPWGPSVDLTETFEHTYAAGGSYPVTVSVFDDDGGTTVLSFTLTVA